MGLFDEWFSSDTAGSDLVANVGDGSNDYFGLTNSATSSPADTGSISNWLDAINSGATAISGTASTVANAYNGINSMLGGGNQEAARAAAAAKAGTGKPQSAGNIFSLGSFGADPTLLLILGAIGAYFLLRH